MDQGPAPGLLPFLKKKTFKKGWMMDAWQTFVAEPAGGSSLHFITGKLAR